MIKINTKYIFVFALFLLLSGFGNSLLASEKDSTHKSFLLALYTGGKTNNYYLYPGSAFTQHTRNEIQFGFHFSYVPKSFGVYFRRMGQDFKLETNTYLKENPFVSGLDISSEEIPIDGHVLGGVYSFRFPLTGKSKEYLTFNTHAGIGFMTVGMPSKRYNDTRTTPPTAVEYKKTEHFFMTKHLSFDLTFKTAKAIAIIAGYEYYWGEIDKASMWQGFERVAWGNLRFGIGTAF